MPADHLSKELEQQYEKHKQTLQDYEIKIGEVSEDLREEIRKRPLTAVAIALLTGFVLARLFQGKK